MDGKLNKLISAYVRPRGIHAQRWGILIGVSLFTGVLLGPETGFFPARHYEIGDIALEDVKAPRDLRVIDPVATERKRLEAEGNVPPVYDHDVMAGEEAGRKVSTAFATVREVYEGKSGLAGVAKGGVGKVFPGLRPALIKNKEEEFQKVLGVALDRRTVKALEAREFSRDLEERLKKILSSALAEPVIFSKDILTQGKGITIRRAEGEKFGPEETIRDAAGLLTLQEAKDRMTVSAPKDIVSLPAGVRQAVLDIAQKLLHPTLTFNKTETESRKRSASEKAEPVLTIVKKGGMIVREGEQVNDAILLRLEALEKDRLRAWGLLSFTGLSSAVFFFLLAVYVFSSTTIKKFNPTPKDIVFMGCALITALIMTRFSKGVSPYLIPVASAPMIVRLILNSEIAIVFSVVTAFLTGMYVRESLSMALYVLMGSLVGSYMLTHCTRRTKVIKAGVVVGLANAVLILCFRLMKGTLLEPGSVTEFLSGAFGGILSGVLVAGLTPLVEAVFNYTTDITLLELANLDHPALRELILQAPGSYHHSIIVSTLSEAAAKAIHCNPLLARVGAYFHDIGKIKMPQYFVENQEGGNRHEQLSPRLSSLVIESHVKEGVDLARKYRLPQPVIDVIVQHHGTSLIRYFYDKAKGKEQPAMDPVKEEEFRYPGPRPQTREAGIVMLADAAEAACRSMTDPTPAQIEGTVNGIIEGVFLAGQLDECTLTLRDLHEISSTFHRVLSGIFHKRVDYPGTVPGSPRLSIVQ